jgi:hypothetical protein
MAAATRTTLLILNNATAKTKTKQKRSLVPKLRANPLVQMMAKSQMNLLAMSQTMVTTPVWLTRKLLPRRNPGIH